MADSSITPRFYKLGPALGIPRLAKNHSLIQLFINNALEVFERRYFALAPHVKRRYPFYAHLHISTYGLQFEFPEHHFLRDMETALPDLMRIRSEIQHFMGLNRDANAEREHIAKLVSQEKFLSRSIISAAFSLVEAFLSGLFYTAIYTKTFGQLVLDDNFLQFARKKESAPLQQRLDFVVRFMLKEAESVGNEPFKSLIEFGKRYRDAIHHTTPFARKDIELGGRLSALYGIDRNIAAKCVSLSVETILRISCWADCDLGSDELACRCEKLREVSVYSLPP